MNDMLHPGDLSPAGAPRVTLVRHVTPGRIRVKIQGLYRSPDLKRTLETLAGRCPAISSLEANPLTGNALVRYPQGRAVAEVVHELEQCARSHCPPRPPRRGHPEPRRERRPDRRPAAPAGPGPEAPGPLPRRDWHARAGEAVLAALETSPEGLASAQIGARLDRYGPNTLRVQKPRSAWSMIAGQLLTPPVALLGLSAVVSVATGGVADALVILSVVVINAGIGYVTESAAERVIASLGALTPAQARVMRDGQRAEVPLEEVVPGDILVLEPGTYIPADGRLISTNRLSVDESALTGESLPVGKHAQRVAPLDTPLADRSNMVHRGTVVTGGSGLAVAVETGQHTEIGLIQSLVGEVKPPETPLQRQLDHMGTQLALLSGVICLAMFGLGLARGFGWLQMLKSSISLAVAAVPEGLPTVATTTLALGIRQMQRRKVLVRQLPAVESLGSIQTLCLDKTGTLTENRMRAVGLELPSGSVTLAEGGFRCEGEPLAPLQREDLRRLLEVVCLCSEVTLAEQAGRLELEGSPTESALIEVALAAGLDIRALRARHPLLKTVHRAEDRPFMVTVHRDGAGDPLIAVKGSPGEVLAMCEYRSLPDGGRVELDDAARHAILDRNERMAGQALRVLGVAYGHSADISTAAVTRNLTWLGLAGMEDTVRPGMDRLMTQFHQAGIDTVMITGDQSTTAVSVGRRLGLNGDKPLEIIDSTSLERLDPDVLASIVADTTVFARVSPAHKLRIVQALQKAGRVVAMTGDGINDGPALKAADVGVALGERGTEVARSVADVVLEDDNLHTMIAAVEQGRTIYANIRKSLRFLLSSNLSEIEVMVFGTAFGTGEVLNPLQLLWINLLTDILPGLGLALEPPEQDVLKQPPRDPREPIIRRRDARRLVRESLALAAGSLGVYGYSLARYGATPSAGTHTFMTITLGQLLHAISCRSERTGVFHPGRRQPNRFLNYALAGSALLQVAAAYFPPLRNLLRLAPVGPSDWLAIAIGATIPFAVNEGVKRLGGEPGTAPAGAVTG
ncbi:cation-translocating P-type ATPase [Candidatus Methylocalor cossyra]|uniref:Ca2+-transporting ATPase n=1 Tax=Candidatus Methylocalor cossyra TaxID=3108543 RepID=A0ABM9NI98_9GAMM